MSYLSSFRIHFSGRFQANVPTANNEVSYMDPENHTYPKSSWNPRGDCTWRLLGCRIVAVVVDGQPVNDAADPIFSFLVQDSDRRSPAKVTDIDPQQQLSTTIYGLDLRICTAAGENLLRGECSATTWNDPFLKRTPSEQFDGRGSAAFQTVVTLFERAEMQPSPLLQRLLDLAPAGRLSLKFNVDGYAADRTSESFTTGRIVGTIGPAEETEPDHFVLGRHLLGLYMESTNHAVAVLDEAASAIRLDVGNSLQVTELGGPFRDYGKLTLQCREAKDSAQRRVLGVIPYNSSPTWYETTAGIVDLPLDAVSLALAKDTAIELWADKEPEPMVLTEEADGYYVRADDVVFRMSPGDTQDVQFYVTCFGQPAAAKLKLRFEPAMLSADGGPSPGVPDDALSWENITINTTGRGVCRLTAHDPKSPRGFFFDGQIYCLRPWIEDAQTARYAELDIVNVRVWDLLERKKPLWTKTVKPILSYYQRLFPIKGRFLDLTNWHDVVEHRELLLLALGLDLDNPNHMPATRDLSPARRDAIIDWLNLHQGGGGGSRKEPLPEPEAKPTKKLPLSPLTPDEMRPGKMDALEKILSRDKKLPLPTK